LPCLAPWKQAWRKFAARLKAQYKMASMRDKLQCESGIFRRGRGVGVYFLGNKQIGGELPAVFLQFAVHKAVRADAAYRCRRTGCWRKERLQSA
jgi:hypothetical protein